MTAAEIQSIGSDAWNRGFEEGLAKGKEIGIAESRKYIGI